MNEIQFKDAIYLRKLLVSLNIKLDAVTVGDIRAYMIRVSNLVKS